MAEQEAAAAQEAVETTEETTATETAETNEQSTETTATEAAAVEEDISYHAVEKDGHVTAIWETQGKKHLRTISPRSEEGKHILALFEAQ